MTDPHGDPTFFPGPDMHTDLTITRLLTRRQRPVVTMAGLPSVNGSPADGHGVSTVR